MKHKVKKQAMIDKSFKVPIDVIEELEELAAVHGSNGRAIQVGTELLIRMARKPRVQSNSCPVASQTYSILPHTLDLIERLLPAYKIRGTVLRAVVHVLKREIAL